MNRIPLPLLLGMVILCCAPTFAQQSIDSSFEYLNDPAKKYSLYIPSGYNNDVPNPIIVAFHPIDLTRWNGKSWRDTLVAFAEANSLILVSPDGGSDGRIDDRLDTMFTTALLDSMKIWYNIDWKRAYAMGFSIGGRVAYTYGLPNVARFGGIMAIGAIVTGTSEVNADIVKFAKGEPICIVHGEQDNPDLGFYPVVSALEAGEAIVNSKLLPGVGATIDFPDRNTIISDAYKWLDSVNLANNTTEVREGWEALEALNQFEIFPNPATKGGGTTLRCKNGIGKAAIVQIVDATGAIVFTKYIPVYQPGTEVALDDGTLPSGAYMIKVTVAGAAAGATDKLIVR